MRRTIRLRVAVALIAATAFASRDYVSARSRDAAFARRWEVVAQRFRMLDFEAAMNEADEIIDNTQPVVYRRNICGRYRQRLRDRGIENPQDGSLDDASFRQTVLLTNGLPDRLNELSVRSSRLQKYRACAPTAAEMLREEYSEARMRLINQSRFLGFLDSSSTAASLELNSALLPP